MVLFGERLRALMDERAISLRQLARRTHYDPGHLSKIVNGHRTPSPEMARRLDETLDASGDLAALIPVRQATATSPSLIAEQRLFDTMELAYLADASDIGAGTVESVTQAGDLLCRAYPDTSPAVLRDRTRQRLSHVLDLLSKRITLDQHRDLLVQAGWLAAVLGCCHYDLGEREQAETARHAVYRMAAQAGHAELMGWAHEMAAWFALVEQRFENVVEAAQAGQAVAGTSSAMVQLILQEAKAHARLGNRRAATRCLDRGMTLLDKLPLPAHPEHHFVFDHTKWLGYAAIVLLGVDHKRAEEHADEVLAVHTRPDGTTNAPRRIANARLDLATVHALRGDLDGAVIEGARVFGDARTSVMGLLTRGAELLHVLDERYPDERWTEEYREQVMAARRALR